MPTMLEFLKAILPLEGRYCLVVIDSKGPRQEFTDTIEALEQRIRYWDGRTDGAVYHGCASYDGRGRRHDNVTAVRSFWLDIDADPADAIVSLERFVLATGLPRPMAVCSGHGLHAYWPLVQAIERGRWEQYARGLKAACERHGLKADPSRTADPSSILRPVGTWNRKREPIEVIGGPLEGPYELEQFDGVLSGSSRFSGVLNDRTSNKLSYGAKVNGSNVSPLLRKLLNVRTNEPIDFGSLTANCGHMRRFEASGGILPEPEWYAAISLLAWVDGGKSSRISGHLARINTLLERQRAESNELSLFQDQLPAGDSGN